MKFEANSQQELLNQIIDAHRVADQLQTQQPRVEVLPTVDPVRRSELENDFRLGKITAEQFLEESGAVSEYLVSNGFDVNSLQAAVEQRTKEAFSRCIGPEANTVENSAIVISCGAATRKAVMFG